MLEHGRRITFAEYDAIPETSRFVEMIDGFLVLSPSVTDAHQRVVGNLMFMLHVMKPDTQVYPPLTGLHLDDQNVAEPDVIWIAENSQCKAGEVYLEGPPDLIVEVLSPGTARQDKMTKFALYERHGVREYWIADPAYQNVEVWTLAEESYTRLGLFGVGNSFTSPVLKQPVDVSAIFAA